MRKIININNDWKFIKENDERAINPSFHVSSWEDVKIPHTWNAIDGANGFEYYKGACWYRKQFNLSTLDTGKRVYVEFQGSNSVTDVYVNGHHLGQHRGGYSTFRFDITDVVQFGSNNTLSVKVDNTVVDDVYPQMADFTFYGGIYRDVNIIITNSIHFDVLDYGAQGVYIIQDSVTDERAALTVRTRLTNDNDEDKKLGFGLSFWIKKDKS